MSYIKPLHFGQVTTKNNLILAPLAGYSHKPMRMINRKFGAGYTVTEMVSVEGILRDSPKTLRYADISDDPEHTSIQLFGKDSPQDFYKASKIIQKIFGVKSININFGCPAPKVMKNGAGSKLLQEPEKIKNIINAVKDSGVSVEAKIRAGFDYDNLDNIITELHQSDVDVIMLHCRLTKDKFLSGTADWSYFKRARALTDKIIIANGDIKTPEDALHVFQEYNVDGIMLGRGAIAKPYLFRQVEEYCSSGTYHTPSAQELVNLIIEYANLWFEITEFETIVPLRGALMSLITGFEGASKLRTTLSQCITLQDVYDAIDKNFILSTEPIV
ncbi:MAG: tRNA dihydrouridine synthase [Brevinemataceae bacterium]